MSNTTIFSNIHLYNDSAVAENGKFMAVSDGIVNYIGSTMPEIDGPFELVEGGYVSKPFCDYHYHLPGSQLYDTFGVNLVRCGSVSRYEDYLISAGENLKIVRGFGWDIESMRQFFSRPGSKTPLEFLDGIFPDKVAVLFSFDFHSCWVNSVALRGLEKEGISSSFKDSEIPHGSECILHEDIADKIFESKRFSFSSEEIRQAILIQQKTFIEKGITELNTLMFIGAGYRQVLSVLNDLDKAGELKIKINYAYTAYPRQSIEEIQDGIKMSKTFQSKHLKLVSTKIYLDGVIDNHSAFLLAPYEDKNVRGKCLWSENALNKVIQCSLEEELPVHIHAIGDGAVKAGAESLSKFDRGNIGRHIIAHLQLCSEETMSIMAEHNIIACMQPFWFYRGEKTIEMDLTRLGQRSFNEYPVKSLLCHGVTVLFSSDCPATNTFDPITGICTAARDDGSDQVISMRDGYKAYCAGAYDGKSVSIKEGDVADFIILSHDITENQNAKVTATYINGERCF